MLELRRAEHQPELIHPHEKPLGAEAGRGCPDASGGFSCITSPEAA